AENALPCDAAVTVGKAEDAPRRRHERIHLHVRDASANASVAAKSVLVAEIEQQVDHGGEGATAPAGVKVVAWSAARDTSIKAQLIDRRTLISDLALKAQHAEIIAGDRVNVEATMVPDGNSRPKL